ncbi:hypothetical protein JHN59_14155 [Streptomyces sp. MBT49]|uniref:hypothetical protein n=1 Tax=Streptomyces sp. MBT49 TaxID=1488380 RepID=UPI00190C0C3C|nr:hypothetical protein [Streptomyces sp. MBT49]MBK3625967.1 hypothetical protein [Streptomyces sp. MBT49]
MTAHPLPLAHLLRPPSSVGGTAGTKALPAVGLATTATALAAAGYHLVFERTASPTACLAVAFVLFAAALLRASGPGALLPDVGSMVLAQAAACCWFAFAASEPGPTGGAFHGGAGGAMHLVMTAVTVGALRTVARSRFELRAMMQTGVRTFVHRLCALVSARTSTVATVDPSRLSGSLSDDGEECLFEVLLVGSTGRRGPP